MLTLANRTSIIWNEDSSSKIEETVLAMYTSVHNRQDEVPAGTTVVEVHQ